MLQGLHEFGIFSTFLPKGEAPSWCNELNKGSSISFIVPSSPNLWIGGLNVCGIYILSNHKETWLPPPLFLRIINKTKVLMWIYRPWSLGIPKGGEELAWLSHWKFGNDLESGDEVIVSVIPGDSFHVTECGINLVWSEQEEKEPSRNVTYNILPRYVITRGIYALCKHGIYPIDRNYQTPSWFRQLLGDAMEFEGISRTHSFLIRLAT